MALHRNSILAGVFCLGVFWSSFAVADDSTITSREDDHRNSYLDDNYIYDYLGHQDTITIGLGDAPTSNIIIQHPTPWPSYINDTTIKISGAQGVDALTNMMEQAASGGAAATSNDVGTNLSNTSSAGMTTASGGN